MIFKNLSLITCLLASLAISACATNPNTTNNSAAKADLAPMVQPDLQYLVSRGERLVDISTLLTGSQNNWVAIAERNNIEDPRLLREGAVLTIPGYLLVPDQPVPDKNAAQALEAKPSQQAVLKKPKKPAKSRNGKIVVYQPTAVPGPKKIKVKMAPVNVNRQFRRSSSDDSVARRSEPNNVAPDNRTDWVLVVGSYYPKGIYQEPDAASRIIIRVAPGSRLRLGGQMREWLQVETDKGVGYIRSSDAEVLAARPAAAKLLARL